MMKNQLSVIGVPMDLGQERRGVDMGPSAIRYAGLVERLQHMGYHMTDRGDIQINRPTVDEEGQNPLKNWQEVSKANALLSECVSDVLENQQFPLILGGDHSIAIGTLAGIAKHFHHLGVIWFDAHGDLNTANTSPSGNIHGMPLAASLGYGHESLTEIAGYSPKVQPENLVIIGARSLDEGERALIRERGIGIYTMHDIDRLGMAVVMQKAIDDLREKTDGIHLSLDLDGLDPQDAPGVGTPVIGGISYRESHLAMEMLAASNMITSTEFVEVNPILDVGNKTATAAVALAGSLFGEKLK